LIDKNVFEASKDRIKWTFENFEKIYLSFSGGKDSTVMFHLVMKEAIKRKRKVGVLFIDWECQFQLTIDHVDQMTDIYKDNIDLFWVALEIETCSACSSFEPLWRSWDEKKKELWTREKNPKSITSPHYFPFYYPGITFEEFVPLFAKWYSCGQETASFVGIRSQESLNRFRAISRHDVKRKDDKMFTVNSIDETWNVYPIYDWIAEDIWTYIGKFNKEYNTLYDRMHKAGLSLNQMRVDEPFGDEARKNLWIYQIIEPVTWAKFVARMSGVNSASLYSNERGNILGNSKVSLPKGHTWESFSNFILDSMPPFTAEHYKNKIAVYLKWYRERGYSMGIPDEGDYRLEQMGKIPAWRQIAKCLLRNDWYCQTLGFGVTKSSAYKKYLELMKKRRSEWGIYSK
jgi:predicted phosphoadenosine phosphosulfate sulfurtransferase